MIGFFIDLVLFIAAVTYVVKYYKFKKIAELELINYEKRLQESEYKVKESEYMYESGVKMYQSEQGDLNPEEENKKYKNNKLKNLYWKMLKEDLLICSLLWKKLIIFIKKKKKKLKKEWRQKSRLILLCKKLKEWKEK